MSAWSSHEQCGHDHEFPPCSPSRSSRSVPAHTRAWLPGAHSRALHFSATFPGCAERGCFDQGSQGAQKWLTLGSRGPYTAWCGGTETSWAASPSSVRCGLPRPSAAQAAGRARARPRFGSVGSLVGTCTKANRMRGQRTEAQQSYPHPQVT